MKIAVITRHSIANYGSLLQAFATQQAIENLGHTCQVIDYIRHDECGIKLELTLVNGKKEWSSNPLKKLAYLAARLPESLYVQNKFEKERKKFLHLTKRYSSLKELTKDKPEADVYVTGSDQVWGPVAGNVHDDAYCLSFASKDAKRISYAASFGRSEMTNEVLAHYKAMLSTYAHVSVREESAVKLLSDLDISSKQVLDPTLLFDSSFWDNYLAPIKQKKYVLVYQLHNNKKLSDYAEKAAKEKGLPLIRISPYLHQCTRSGKFVWCPSVGRFLSYIKNAELVITDSFHGTAFSINFNTPFIEILPNNNTETRNISVLNLFNLSNRLLKDENDLSLVNAPIDFSFANEKLMATREESLQILKDLIEK